MARRPIAAAFDAYAQEYLADASPEERNRARDAFYAGAATVHFNRADPAKSYAQQHRHIRKIASDLAEFASAAVLKERSRA